MIPRYQKVLFVLLLVASLAMAAELWHLRQRAHQRLLAGQDSAPTRAPEVAPDEPATLVVASDLDGSLTPQARSLPLPSDPEARARVLLGNLLDLYAATGAAHPVPGGTSGIAQVFLMPLPAEPAPASPSTNPPPAVAAQNAQDSGPRLAVVNFTGSFAASHPSGIETESLTIQSICATLRANLPRVAQVRFLVDGQPRNTLAGHADLTRTYLTADSVLTSGAADTATSPAQSQNP
ncbi:MAG TPA: GerMN domain-containing protein [Terracidiphilus sp.]|nr:GerMN domain-containing protein [Terracidiphilus sp.]